MRLISFKNTFFLSYLLCFSCVSQQEDKKNMASEHFTVAGSTKNIITGADQPEKYLSLLAGKKIGLVANQTSILIETNSETAAPELIHLVDYLVENKIDLRKVFAPEHGFRGTADAGELIKDGVDLKTGVPIISIYGNNKKPTAQQLEGIDLMIFDIQDVGARFYTYISSLHYVMEACAEANIPLLILDRPNPNGNYIDGPILELEYKSFVGMHAVPVVHGMTIAEYAQMINGQGWLENGVQCELEFILMKNYNHQTTYSLPIKPSPNLPNDVAINLYPSLCFFEGTIISAGRGTDMQFQIFGAPSLPASKYPFQFAPTANEGAKYPKFMGELCNGSDLRETPRLSRLNLTWLIEAHQNYEKQNEFFNSFFTNLAGTKKLQEQIKSGIPFSEIQASWSEGLEKYDAMRQPYLLYTK